MPPRDPLRLFEHWENLPPTHENELTRALLVTLRLSPAAHQAWLDEVTDATAAVAPDAPPLRVSELPECLWQTQTGTVQSVPTNALVDGQASGELDVRSVRLAPGRAVAATSDPHSAERPIYDAVARYDSELTVILETKLQADPVEPARRVTVDGVEYVVPTVEVSWWDLLRRLHDLLDRADLIAGTERTVVDEFVRHVDKYFAALAPAHHLAAAADSPEGRLRRCHALLTEVSGLEAQSDRWGAFAAFPSSGGTASRVYLLEEDDELRLHVAPADIGSQAKRFYADTKTVQCALDLAEKDHWGAAPNMHLAQIHRVVIWADASISLRDYCAYWAGHTDDIRRLYRPGHSEPSWQAPLEEWHRLGIVSDADVERFDEVLTNGNGNQVDPRPGLSVWRAWSLQEAAALDRAGALRGQIDDAYRQLVACFGAG